VEVREIGRPDERRVMVAVGNPAAEAIVARDYPIVYVEDGGAAHSIGVLHVEATLSGVYNRLWDKAVIILASQGVKTFLVSLFILFIVHRLVTRHLAAIAGFLHGYDPRSTTAPLVLARRAPRHKDELDQMTVAFNAMSARLQELYQELAGLNAELEWDIAARQQAEAEVTRLNAELEQRVRQRTAELEAANRELDAFTYSVSHDLRAPLRRIEGFGRILGEDYADRFDERGQHFLERIRAGSQEMADMIDSFLKLSRSTRSELTVESANLSELAEAVVARLREREPDRAVAVSIAPGLTARGDRRLLGAVLENLLGNAWKYTRHTEAAAMSLTAEKAAGRTVYVVRDNGAGFDMAYADRLFMPFSRLHRPEDFEGTGIGLATVVRILTRHGGRIWAEGAVGKGATFRFTLWEGSAT
jgi:signal transduction histidine kinase